MVTILSANEFHNRLHSDRFSAASRLQAAREPGVLAIRRAPMGSTKSHKKTKKPPKDLVLMAMKNNKWDYRTVRGLAVETKHPETVVSGVL